MIKRVLFGTDPEPAEKVHHLLLVIVRLVLVLAFISSVLEEEMLIAFIITLNLIITFLPRLYEKKYHIDIPIEFEILIIVFVYASLFLGEVQGFYSVFWWWDLLLHAGAGVAIGFAGFAILYVMYKGGRIRASPRTIALFAFCFSLSAGALWEIYEFGMDQAFGLNMQKSGLMDTMADLIVDALGALFASFIGYLYLKYGRALYFEKVINRFVNNNPHLFNKRRY